MSDLIARLLHTIVVDGLPLLRPDGLHIEAAAELERLQSELAFYDSKCAKCGDHLGLLAECPHCRDIARLQSELLQRDAVWLPERDAQIERLQSQLDQANARERKAFEAGWERSAQRLSLNAPYFTEEQAWQQYRSQDDSEGRAGEGDG